MPISFYSNLLTGIHRYLLRTSASLGAGQKQVLTIKPFLLGVAFSAAMGLQTSTSLAIDFEWDTDSGAGLDGGNGDWNLDDANWTTNGGGNSVKWDNATTSRAIFTDGPARVAIGGPIIVGSLIFESNGYRIVPFGSSDFFSISTPVNITVKDDPTTTGGPIDTAIIEARITGGGGIIVDGDGRLILRGQHTFTGFTTVAPNGTLQNEGTLGDPSTAIGVNNSGRLINVAGATINGGVRNTGIFEAAGTVVKNVDNSGNGVIRTIGNFTINGKLTNSSGNVAGVDIGTGERLAATDIINNAGSTIVNAGTLRSTNQIDNRGAIRSSGTIEGGISNIGTILASGTIVGAVDNAGNGTLDTDGNLRINGLLTNTSSSAAGISISPGELLRANGIVNQIGSTIVNVGFLNSDTAIANGGTIDNTGQVNGGVSNTGIILNGGTINDGITNSGTVTTTNLVRGGIDNIGTVNASGTIEGPVANGGIGTINTNGSLIIDGILTNKSTNAQAIFVEAGESLQVDGLVNQAGSFVLNQGTLSSASAIGNGGTITNSGTLNGGISNTGTVDNTNRINGNITNSGTVNTTGRIDGDVDNANVLNASGTINGAVGNSGTLLVNAGGTLTITGTLTNTSASAAGVSIGATETLIAGGISNLANSTIVNAGKLSSNTAVVNRGTIANTGELSGGVSNTATGILNNSSIIDGGVVNSGTVNSTGTINHGLNNAATVNASGTINGAVANTGNGTINTTGALTVNGTLTNSSTNSQGISIEALESLTVTTLDNQSGAFVVNAGTLSATAPSVNGGTITNTGAMNASLDGRGTGQFFMNGGTFTGSTSALSGFTQNGGTIAAGSTIGAAAFGQTGGTSAGATITAPLRVFAVGGTISLLSPEQTVAFSNGNLTVEADSSITLGNFNGQPAISTASNAITTITVAAPIIGNEGIRAAGFGAASSINISTSGPINTTSTAISMLADPAGVSAVASIAGDVTVTSSDAAFASTGNTTFNVASGAKVNAANILDAISGTVVLNNAGFVRGAFDSGPGNLSIVNSSSATMELNGSSQFGGALDQLSNTGLFRVIGSPSLNGLETFTNASGGSIDMTASGGADSLLLGGAMANLSGSQIIMNADLDDTNGGTNGDLITVVGNLSSSGGVLVLANIDGNNSFGQVTELGLIQANSIDPGASFSVLTPGNQGIFTYEASILACSAATTFQCSPGANQAIVVKGIIDPQAAGGVVSNFIAAQDAVSNAFFKPASGFVSSPLDPEPNQLGFSLWSRASGGFTSQGSQGVAILAGGPQPVESSVKVGFGGYQFGVDGGWFNIAESGANLHLGITAGQVFGAAKQDNVNNKTDMQDTFIGMYGIFSKGPFFVDAQLRQEFIDYTVNVDDRGFRVQDGEASSQRFSAGISGGYSFAVGNFSLVPAAGYTFARTSTDSLSFNPGPNSATVFFEDSTSHVAFAGISAATSFLLFDDQLRVSPFVSATAYHDFGKDQEATLAVNTSTGLVEIDVTSGSGKTYGELSLGANFLTLTPEIAGTQRLLSGNVRGDVQFGEERLGGSLNAQIRLQF
jgi:uncharacterized protein YhjY with autotransporter beta-barrel domain